MPVRMAIVLNFTPPPVPSPPGNCHGTPAYVPMLLSKLHCSQHRLGGLGKNAKLLHNAMHYNMLEP